MSICYLDTHVAVWLHDGLGHKLTRASKKVIEASEIRISPMVYLEFDYLHRRGRIRQGAASLYANLRSTLDVVLCPFSFPAVAHAATQFDWTSDPFDRIIVAHAKANGQSPLVTADETIRSHYRNAVW
ncbi:MAG: PIN domain-containing protein [Bryobacteraceae bacterium]